jgi:AcrR family transcriptional regulator
MPRRYSMTNRAAESDATRRQILDAVVEVAAASGIDATTVQAVAARADVAVRTVYNHFGSREELIAAALGDLAEQTRASVRAIEVADLPPRERVLAFVEAYARSYDGQGTGVQVLMDATTIPVVVEAVTEVRAWRRQQLRRMLRAAQDDGTLELPLADAVNIAYLATAYTTYASLVHDEGLSATTARATLRAIVDRTLFVPATRPREASA